MTRGARVPPIWLQLPIPSANIISRGRPPSTTMVPDRTDLWVLQFPSLLIKQTLTNSNSTWIKQTTKVTKKRVKQAFAISRWCAKNQLHCSDRLDDEIVSFFERKLITPVYSYMTHVIFISLYECQ